MEKVLYRAKRKDNGKWVEGYYAKAKWYLDEKDLHVIFPIDLTLYPHSEFSEYYEIIPETLCRCITHPCYDSDCSDETFFSNDIIAIWGRHDDVEHDKPNSIGLVIDEHTITVGGLGRRFPQDTTRVKIIGNAYDNPELLHGHDMNHFINSLNEYPGDYTDYLKHHQYLTDKYGIHGAHACCYMCNFENDYICHQYNGGCRRIDTCQHIHKQERKG